MTTEQKQAAQTYIRRIRNASKKTYAQQYNRYLLNGQQGEEPRAKGLSFMGEQSVRLWLEREIYQIW